MSDEAESDNTLAFMSDLLHQLLPLYQRRPYWQSFRSKTDEKVSVTTLMWLYFKFDKKNDANGCFWCYVTKRIPL
ncbi:putative uncharacterized protein [Vibrio anguillarum]|nr:putative uncharacterized protein [Vibrio anguillarum]